MRGINVTRTIKCSAWLSADDWGLYTGEGYEGAENVANDLNRELMKLVNDEGADALTTLRHLEAHAEVWQFYGATDTAVRDIMFMVVHHIFHGAD
jgi:hypothetical protein